MAKTTKPMELTKEDFDKLHSDIKGWDNGWVALLVDQIKEHCRKPENKADKRYKDVNARKIYNIFNGAIKDAGWKLFVYKQAKAFIKSKEDEIAALKSKCY